jgi:hypothetical protein
VNTMGLQNSRERDRFWEAYRGCAEENRVRPDRSAFYVRWVKDFESFLQGKPLGDRSRNDIQAFLADLGRYRGSGATTVGTCQCRNHYDLHPRTEQTRDLSKPR